VVVAVVVAVAVVVVLVTVLVVVVFHTPGAQIMGDRRGS